MMRKIKIFFIAIITLITFQSIVTASKMVTCPRCGGSGTVEEYSEAYGRYMPYNCPRCLGTGQIESSDTGGSGGGGVCLITPFFITLSCCVFIVYYGKKHSK